MTEETEKKKFYGSAYQKTTGKNKDGEEFELRRPNYQIQFDVESVESMTPDEEGNLKFSIHERKEADALREKKRPTCYLQQNTYAEDGRIDIYSLCDIVVKKDDIIALAKDEVIGEKNVRMAYISTRADGTLQSTMGRYDEVKAVEGRAFTVDSVDRQMKAAKERMGDKEVKLDTVGVAWKFENEGKEFFQVCLNADKVKFLPVNKEKELMLSLRPMKEVKSEKSPSYNVVPNTEFLNGRIDIYAEIDFKLRKQDALNEKAVIEEKTNYEGKEYTSHSTYIHISEDGNLSLSKAKYKDVEGADKIVLFGAKAEKVDREARKAELDKRAAAAKERSEKKEAETEEKGAAMKM